MMEGPRCRNNTERDVAAVEETAEHRYLVAKLTSIHSCDETQDASDIGREYKGCRQQDWERHHQLNRTPDRDGRQIRRSYNQNPREQLEPHLGKLWPFAP